MENYAWVEYLIKLDLIGILFIFVIYAATVDYGVFVLELFYLLMFLTIISVIAILLRTTAFEYTVENKESLLSEFQFRVEYSVKNRIYLAVFTGLVLGFLTVIVRQFSFQIPDMNLVQISTVIIILTMIVGFARLRKVMEKIE
jgi:uncharacterized membrane protein YesL